MWDAITLSCHHVNGDSAKLLVMFGYGSVFHPQNTDATTYSCHTLSWSLSARRPHKSASNKPHHIAIRGPKHNNQQIAADIQIYTFIKMRFGSNLTASYSWGLTWRQVRNTFGFWKWFGAQLATNQYINYWRPSSLTHMCFVRLQGVSRFYIAVSQQICWW